MWSRKEARLLLLSSSFLPFLTPKIGWWKGKMVGLWKTVFSSDFFKWGGWGKEWVFLSGGGESKVPVWSSWYNVTFSTFWVLWEALRECHTAQVGDLRHLDAFWSLPVILTSSVLLLPERLKAATFSVFIWFTQKAEVLVMPRQDLSCSRDAPPLPPFVSKPLCPT